MTFVAIRRKVVEVVNFTYNFLDTENTLVPLKKRNSKSTKVSEPNYNLD